MDHHTGLVPPQAERRRDCLVEDRLDGLHLEEVVA
jgi:hypothetical protein